MLHSLAMFGLICLHEACRQMKGEPEVLPETWGQDLSLSRSPFCPENMQLNR